MIIVYLIQLCLSSNYTFLGSKFCLKIVYIRGSLECSKFFINSLWTKASSCICYLINLYIQILWNQIVPQIANSQKM